MSGGAPNTSTTLIAPPSPGLSSVFTMCFPNEITDYGGIDGVMSSDDYDEELLHMVINQPELDSVLHDFCVLILRDYDAPPTPAAHAIMDDVIIDIASPDILGHVVGESDFVGPPLFFFYILSRFVSRSNDVLSFSSMDLSIFKYSPIYFIDNIDSCAPHSPTSHIHDIDDEPLQPDFDDSYRFDLDHSFIDERVSPPFHDLETVDLDIANHLKELYSTTLSANEKDSFLRLLRSYLNVFAWSYEDMPGLDSSIVHHHLPLVPHTRPVK